MKKTEKIETIKSMAENTANILGFFKSNVFIDAEDRKYLKKTALPLITDALKWAYLTFHTTGAELLPFVIPKATDAQNICISFRKAISSISVETEFKEIIELFRKISKAEAVILKVLLRLNPQTYSYKEDLEEVISIFQAIANLKFPKEIPLAISLK